MRCRMAAFTALLMSGCMGPNPNIGAEDVSQKPAAILSTAGRVAVYEGAGLPPKSTPISEVTTTSCKNKLWDAAPTEADALEKLKVAAVEKGANALAEVRYVWGDTSVGRNCWSSITATGMALKIGG